MKYKNISEAFTKNIDNSGYDKMLEPLFEQIFANKHKKTKEEIITKGILRLNLNKDNIKR